MEDADAADAASDPQQLTSWDVVLLSSSGAAVEYGWATGEATIIMHLRNLGMDATIASLVSFWRSSGTTRGSVLDCCSCVSGLYSEPDSGRTCAASAWKVVGHVDVAPGTT